MTKLTPEQREEVRTALKEAIYYLVKCWDAQHKAEFFLGVDVESNDIQELAGDCDTAEEAHFIPDVDLDHLIAELMGEKKD